MPNGNGDEEKRSDSPGADRPEQLHNFPFSLPKEQKKKERLSVPL